MNSRMMVAGLAIGSLLVAGLPAAPVARAHGATTTSGPMSGMAGGLEDCHTAMASMMWMMHQHRGMMSEGLGMMGEGHGMMGEGMMGASPEREATAAPPRTGPGDQIPAPEAFSITSHEQHHPSSSPNRESKPVVIGA